MKPVTFEGYNTVFAADQPQYLPLPTYRNRGGNCEVVSCWSLTFVERIKILFIGRIFLTVWTFGQPLQPQRPSVESPIEIKSSTTN